MITVRYRVLLLASECGTVEEMTVPNAPTTPLTADALVHLCPKDEWLQAHTHGRLEPASLETVGFVHLSALRQVHIPANALFAGREDLVLLLLSPDRIPAEIRWEEGDPPDPGGMTFPHLYGPLPVTAVADVIDYLPQVDGSFAARP